MLEGSRGRRGESLRVGILAFLLAAGLFYALYSGFPLLHDTDAYYHLAVARAYWEGGILDHLPWVRFSAMAEGFGDKELLFHLFLAPFAGLLEPLVGGSITLGLLDSLLLAVVAGLAARALGIWAALVPLWLLLGSGELAWRLVRLRPELLSLLILLAALALAGRRRYRLVGFLALLYALAYTAFHAFLGLMVLLFAYRWWLHRKAEWALPLYAVLGVGTGLLLHPHFPANLTVWWLQNVEYFRLRPLLDVGTEIRPSFTDVALITNLGWWVGLVAIWRSARPGEPPRAAEQNEHEAWSVAAVAFGGLYLLMSRFALYAVPLVTLALLSRLRRAGLVTGPAVRLPGRGWVPSWLAAGLCLLVSLPGASRELARYGERTRSGPGAVRIEDRKALARALPEGAWVAAPWGSTPIYMLWAPQGRYLNALDPVFFAAIHPEEWAVEREIFSGREPDVPVAVWRDLDSQFLAYSIVGESPMLSARLRDDPRVRVLHRGFNGLFALDPEGRKEFVLDWRVAPAGIPTETPPDADFSAWLPYPLLTGTQGEEIEGYVDGRRLGTDSCQTFAREFEVQSAETVEWEFAPWGPSRLGLDGKLLVQIGGSPRAILGEGARVAAALTSGRHRLTVQTCLDEPGGAGPGFYLLRRRGSGSNSFSASAAGSGGRKK